MHLLIDGARDQTQGLILTQHSTYRTISQVLEYKIMDIQLKSLSTGELLANLAFLKGRAF